MPAPLSATAILCTVVTTIVSAALLAGCGGPGADAVRTLALAECRLPRLAAGALCGELEVPENRDLPAGRAIKLSIAVLPANTLSPRPDPLFILAGGPGQAASALGPFAAALVGVRKERDIVLVDQRGSGRSSPLDCAAFRPDRRPEAAIELDPVPKATACAAELAARGVDAAQYTTAAFVADLDAVRAALGYQRINLWGGSYGTRAALEYLRAHGDRVRSVVLDGVAPPSMRISLDVWVTRDAALSAIVAACRDAPACRAAHPDLAATLDGIRTALGPDGSDVPVADPATGEIRPLRLSFAHVVATLHSLTYAPELRALVPEVIARAAAGDFAPLFGASSLITADLAEQMSTALHYSVTCAEDVPRVTADELATALAGNRAPALPRYVLAVCAVWPQGRAPADMTTPVASERAVLLLSGALDPVTPPANAEEVRTTLPNSRHVVAAGHGHIVSPHGCGPRLIAAFIDRAGFDTLPASCIEHFERGAPPALWADRLGAPR